MELTGALHLRIVESCDILQHFLRQSHFLKCFIIRFVRRPQGDRGREFVQGARDHPANDLSVCWAGGEASGVWEEGRV